jgi:hypothetical protein
MPVSRPKAHFASGYVKELGVLVVTQYDDDNPYQSPRQAGATEGIVGQESPGCLSALLFGTVGCLLGMASFLLVGSCFAYYVGAIIHGFGQQPPVEYVQLGAGLSFLPGCVCGALAGLRLQRGLRPNLVLVTLIGLANMAALLGTIQIDFNVSFQSNAIRTAIVGAVSGIIFGLIVSLLSQRVGLRATEPHGLRGPN